MKAAQEAAHEQPVHQEKQREESQHHQDRFEYLEVGVRTVELQLTDRKERYDSVSEPFPRRGHWQPASPKHHAPVDRRRERCRSSGGQLALKLDPKSLVGRVEPSNHPIIPLTTR